MRRAAVLVSRVVPIVVTFVFVVLQKKGLEKAGWIAPGRGEVNSIGHNHDERKKLTPQFTLNCLFIAAMSYGDVSGVIARSGTERIHLLSR